MPARMCQVWAYGRLMHMHTELLAAAEAQALAILRVRSSGHRAPGHLASLRAAQGLANTQHQLSHAAPAHRHTMVAYNITTKSLVLPKYQETL